MQVAIVIPLSEIGGMPGLPGQGLPGGPVFPGQGLPGGPAYPGHGLPGQPGHPEHGLPPVPGAGQLPELPPSVWPPEQGRPSNPIQLPPPISSNLPIHPVGPTHPISLPPGTIWPPLPPSIPAGVAVALVAISGVGYRWAVITIPQPK